MAYFCISRYFFIFFLIFYIKKITATSNCSFHFKKFDKDSKFGSDIGLYGDAKAVNDGLSLQITGPLASSAGRIMYKKPIKLVEGIPTKLASFSTSFSFSLSPQNGDGIAFVMVPIGFPLNVFNGTSFGLLSGKKLKVLAVEFDTLMDDKYGDVNGNHVGIDMSSLVSVKVRNVSSIKLVLNSGEKLQAWIDYEAGSRRLEVRLGKFGERKPVEPLLFFPIDLSIVWKEKEVLVGLSSSNGNSSQICNVYSWSFEQRQVPHWMHSQPLDPNGNEEEKTTRVVDKRKDCHWIIIAALILGTGCGALGATFLVLVWAVFGNRRPIVPEELAVKPVEYDYKKFIVVVDKATEIDCMVRTSLSPFMTHVHLLET